MTIEWPVSHMQIIAGKHDGGVSEETYRTMPKTVISVIAYNVT